MKHLLTTFAVAALAVGSMMAETKTDVLSVQNFLNQDPNLTADASSYTDADKAQDFTYTGESGAVYDIKGAVLMGANDEWALAYGTGNVLNTTTSGGYLTSFTIDWGWKPSYMYFYVSDEPLNADNYYNGQYVYVDLGSSANPTTWTADGIYKYIYFPVNQERFKTVSFEWSDERPVIACKKPSVSMASEIYPKSNCSVYNSQDGATLHVSVLLNDVVDTELSKDVTESSYSFEVPGAVGDKVTVKAYASKEGYSDSEIAEETRTIVMPPAERPMVTGYTDNWEVVSGMELTITSETPDATISYTWEIGDWNDNDYEGPTGKGSGTSPVKVTVPEGDYAGKYFAITAYANAEGYTQSQRCDQSWNIISAKLGAPEFSVANGSEVRPGTVLTITPPANAKELHYTVNGGEEQTTEWSATVTINEDMTVEAWATGEAPFTTGDKVTCTYKVEQILANMNALVPGDFTEENLNVWDFNDYTYQATLPKGNVTYTYQGGFRVQQEVPCFYFSAGSFENPANLKNNEAYKISRIKVDAGNSWCKAYLYVSTEPIAEVTTEMTNYDPMQGRVRIGDGEDAHMGEWIDAKELLGTDEDPLYFVVYPFAQNVDISRIVVEYEADQFTGVESIEAEEGETAVYSLDGMLMTGKNLPAGIYVRKNGAKAEKFVVK